SAFPKRSVFAQSREMLLLQQIRVNPDNQYLLIIRPIKNANPSSLREPLGRPPEVIVVQFFMRGALEAGDFASLWVEARHHVLDRAILSRGIQSLEHQQKGVGISSRQNILFAGHPFDVRFELP